MKLTDAEIKVMNLLWKYSDLSAKNIAIMLGERVGWSKNTTYTVIKSCVDKGYIERREPHYICHALVKKKIAQDEALQNLLGKLFDGSKSQLIAALARDDELNDEEFAELKKLRDEMK